MTSRDFRDVNGLTLKLDTSNPQQRLAARGIIWRGGEVVEPEGITAQEREEIKKLYEELVAEGSPGNTYLFQERDGSYRYLDLNSSGGRDIARNIVRDGGSLVAPPEGRPQQIIEDATRAKEELEQEILPQTIAPVQTDEREDALEDLGTKESEFGAQTGSETLNWPEEDRSAAESALTGDINETASGATLEPSESDRFTFIYKNMMGEARQWRFSLMPAIDSNISNSRSMGNRVPEAKPGLMVNTVMRHRNIVIPGGLPVVQTVGPEMIVIQLVGAFIGNEGIEGTDKSKLQGSWSGPITNFINEYGDGSQSTNRGSWSGPIADYANSNAATATNASEDTALYGTWGVDRADIEQLDSHEKAREFNKEVVLQGAPVVLEVLSAKDNNSSGERKPVAFVYKGVISGFKIYTVRKDRTYWSLNFLVTEYGVEGKYKNALEEDRAKAKDAAEAAAQSASEQSASTETAEGQEEGPAGLETAEDITEGSAGDIVEGADQQSSVGWLPPKPPGARETSVGWLPNTPPGLTEPVFYNPTIAETEAQLQQQSEGQ